MPRINVGLLWSIILKLTESQGSTKGQVLFYFSFTFLGRERYCYWKNFWNNGSRKFRIDKI